MKEPKRITLFSGHYGSGKTNIAVNYAKHLKRLGKDVVIADLDIVNPYFRTKDSEAELSDAGIALISPRFANSNVDLPALPQEAYSIFHRRDRHAVIDVGGDDRGALALGRYAPFILEENDFEMVYVASCYRPLTRTAKDALEVMREIEAACSLPFTAIVNNSNVGRDTDPADVISSQAFIEELCALSGLPLLFTSANRALCKELETQIDSIFPLDLAERYYDIKEK